MATNTPATVTDSIISLLKEHGQGDYIGERISQLAHCLQCAYLAALSEDADEETILAALLHDVGQFLPASEATRIAGETVKDMRDGNANVTANDSGSVGRVGHEAIGAKYLQQLNFSPKVCTLVGSHVAAKRYLCAVDPTYYGTLSEASKKSLQIQGGPMNERELNAWRQSGLAEEMCRLRKWDDSAKIVDWQVPDVENYRQLITQHLELRV